MAYKKIVEKKKAFALFNEGMQFKDIATAIGVTPKSVGRWYKEFKQIDTSNEKLIAELRSDVEALKKEVLQLKSNFKNA